MTSPLRLGFDPEFAPLTYLEEGGATGRAICVVRAACAHAGLDLELVAVGLAAQSTFGELRLDGFACMAVTPDRTEFTFSVPYLTTRAAFFFARSEGERWDTTTAGGITVATPRCGPLFDPLSTATAARDHPSLHDRPALVPRRVVPGTDYRDCLRRVLAGEVDAAALNAEVGGALVAQLHPDAFFERPAPLPELGLAVALAGEPRHAKLLLARLDPALEAESRGSSAL
ncbi:MAG: substrate-binding periplasmic protein [Thermoleophilia bacterium]